MRTPLVTSALLALLAAVPRQADPVAARSKGRPDAPVTVYEMSDFQCPYCRGFALETMPLLEQEYVATGKVRLVYITLPRTARARLRRRRSEEHTSELQSPDHLVCRLLLEKKKKKHSHITPKNESLHTQ